MKLSSLDLKQRLLTCIKPQAKAKHFSTNKDEGLVSMVVARSARVKQQLGSQIMQQRRGLMVEIEWDSVASFVDRDPPRCTKL